MKVSSLQEINIDLVNHVKMIEGRAAAYELSSAWKEWNLRQRKQDKKEKMILEEKIRTHLKKLGLWDEMPKIIGWYNMKEKTREERND